MKNILFPTDFSPAAENAMNYASAFAMQTNARLILFNVYPVPSYAGEAWLPIDESSNEDLKSEAEALIKLAKRKIQLKTPGLKVESSMAWGFPGDEIVFNAKERKADMVIMGAEGAGSTKRFFLGSNTAEVFNKATCPVLAIPNGYTFRDFKHIAFSTDCFDYEIPSIKFTADLAKQFNATLTLVHIEDSIMNKIVDKEVHVNFINRVRCECNLPGIKLEILKEQDIVKGLTWFTDTQIVDLLVIAHRKRSGLTQLINPSIARKISFILTSPLLSVPVNAKID